VGAQDMVILAMKAHQVEAVANEVPKLFGPDTVVVTMQNGVPYWYFHRHGGDLAGSSGSRREPPSSSIRAASASSLPRISPSSGSAGPAAGSSAAGGSGAQAGTDPSPVTARL